MKRVMKHLFFTLAVFIPSFISAQTVTGSGTPGTIPIFTGAGNNTNVIGNSNPTITQSGTITFFSGAIAAGTTNGVLNAAMCGTASPPTWCSGNDIGAWIQAAIAELGGAGTIFIPDGSYNYSSTISISQNQQQGLTILCGSRNAKLNYTGNTNAIYITSNQNSAAQVNIENCSLYGTSAGSSANGIYLYDAQNTHLTNNYVYGFQSYNLYGLGTIGGLFVGNDFVVSGNWNIKLLPDAANNFQSNTNHFIGGSIANGGAGNFWDAGTTALDDQHNSLSHVTFEENTAKPQILLEDTEHDSVDDAYVEYLSPTSSSTALCSIILGNYAGSGWGSNTAQISYFPSISNVRMATPGSSSSNLTADVCLLGTNTASINQISAFGNGGSNPEYGFYFYPGGPTNANPSIGPSDMQVGALYNITTPYPAHIWELPGAAALSPGQYSVGNDGGYQASSFYSYAADNLTIPNVTATTIFTLPNVPTSAWIITATCENGANAGYYNVTGLTTTQGTTASLTELQLASGASLSVSGLNVRYYQSSGGPCTTGGFRAIRIF